MSVPPGADRTPSRGARLRIAFVGTAHPMRGGLAQFNAALCHALAKHHDVALFSFRRQYPSFLFPGRSQMDESEQAVAYPAEAVVDSIAPPTWFDTARRIAAWNADGLVFKYWMPFFAPAFGTIARRAKRHRPGLRVVAILDNVIPHEHRPFDGALTRYFTGGVDAFIAMSETVRRDLLTLLPSATCRLVPHPVYDVFGEPSAKAAARAALGLPANEPILLFFGFVRAYKGLDVLLDALPRIRERVPARLLVLGEFYAGREETDRRIAALGLRDAVVVQDGFVPNERVGVYFSASDVVVLPYRSATQSGIVPIALQMRRPVISTNVGGLAEMVHDGVTGLLVPPENPSALADAVVRYFEESLEEPFARAIEVERQRYSWEAMASAVAQLVHG